MSNIDHCSNEPQLFLLSEYFLMSTPSNKELLMVKKGASDLVSGVRFVLNDFLRIQWQSEPSALLISVENPPSEPAIVPVKFPLKESFNSFLLNEDDGSLHLTGIGVSDLITGNNDPLKGLFGFARQQEKVHINIPFGKQNRTGQEFEIPELYLMRNDNDIDNPFWDLRFRLVKTSPSI